MPDKKYKELTKRLDTAKRGKKGNFRSYEEIRQNISRERPSEPSRIPKSGTKPQAPAKKRPPQAQRKPAFSAPGSSGNKKMPSKPPSPRYPTDALFTKLRFFLPYVLIAIVVLLAFWGLTHKNATEILLGEETVGQLKTTKITKEDLTNSLIARLEQTVGTQIQLDSDITLKPVHGKKKLLMDDSTLLNTLADQVSYKILASEITVDGVPVGVLKNKDDAQAVFDALYAKFPSESEENVSYSFVEDVQVVDKFVKEGEISSIDTVRAEMEKTNTASDIYEVKSGDTLSKICSENNMTMVELKEHNPDLDVNKSLSIGQKMNVISTTPFVSVKTVESKSEEMPIERKVVEQTDDSLKSGQTRIIQQGKDGVKEVTTEIIRINGIVVEKSEGKETVKEPAEDQIIARGTQ